LLLLLLLLLWHGSLLTQQHDSILWPPQVEPSDLPTFGPLQSCCLHCVKFWVKSNRGGFIHSTSGAKPFQMSNNWVRRIQFQFNSFRITGFYFPAILEC
jgi:hypothetical protein